MDELLNNAPALAYVKHMEKWFAVNNWGEPISWTDERVEVPFLLEWVLELKPRRGADASHKILKLNSATPMLQRIRPEASSETGFSPKLIALAIGK